MASSNPHSLTEQATELFLGYCRKRMPEAPGWLGDPRVSRIASVSEGIAKRPEGWVDRWDFNAAGLYDSVDAANTALGALDRSDYPLFAYTIVPTRFDPCGGSVVVTAASLFGSTFVPVQASSQVKGFRFLGFDAVERWAELQPGHVDQSALGGGFGCSPLSCNNLSHGYDVSANCLLTNWAEARRAAQEFAKPDGAEPGCYYVFGVYLEDAMAS